MFSYYIFKIKYMKSPSKTRNDTKIGTVKQKMLVWSVAIL